ncbi:tRNA (guanosine(46)-N7)-methyltransferase TrmB [Anaerocolumna sp. AGMB13025]|uniref:tRNA (guanosine(46)-N7)-methyltransferase TrmB n=1 Tax=Anaerocolumna sp. AGMB13025 TaxID=3039116 RepID=UPI00241FF2AC|nr:tRNA (guanosine(46)-N7)-methyltransferase TrmB [Anaerocolumna sp. AGMB13025]WFR57482.1 tRNA (guanosine(46)-N7)-methyltransferase TrmB [Anaerocolumna sp. AGMB13025]
MRLRNVTGSREIIAENEFVVHEPENYKGKWRELFKNDNPLHIEIGMGKGKFLIQLAQENPDINYIGIEKYSSVLIRAVEKRKELEINNLWLIRFDADYINDIFDTNEVARIYLNFSDPWPKDRHAKRRLTSKEFLARYDKFLAADGEVIFKTDNSGLFEFSLEQVEVAGWKLRNYTHDLHHSEFVKGNVMTEYEEKFSAMGNPIHRLEAFR